MPTLTRIHFYFHFPRATSPRALSSRLGTVHYHPGRICALHSSSRLHKTLDPISSTEPSTLGDHLSAQQWLKWQHCHTQDVRLAPRATHAQVAAEQVPLRAAYAASDDNITRRRSPTESEEDVVADRSDDDPLPPGAHHTIRLPAGEAAPRPTESEEDVAADRSEDNPLPPGVRGPV
ncbi:hypothetical protein QBC33DRAFT_548400 [Phialemonium atrogriseum]|uniref:Uncharacterized protein n=1 Tax=Phialemonium atrogriseum TaxID=1093897 RepID=A0AAJ0FI26_9PEZI|nr:uncharacterized protein QBC33DRAFT_548400 [Phialemonium atrogriseum]KAK1763948.1 hypothetical protein QBC33DRAFT_548400 [Phialemonium atrogriseum]